ncbi:aminotransferase class IV [Aureispira anguillae]|uniref:branched-chain-amino-acid transaminase n=1 Tax=Aureispira anguillae TaxID=2864201 RepID=A0A915YF19_9BACT|nr:aminotransferase class IV [Aureispira anguillae]BDS11939.1 aminotransferase class IV [Aureispira anguillae]
MHLNQNSLMFLDGQWLRNAEVQRSFFHKLLGEHNAIFEGVRSYQTAEGLAIFKAHEHCKRLFNSTKKMGLDFSYSIDDLIQLMYQLIEKNKLQDAYIRSYVYWGEASNSALNSHLLLVAWPWDQLVENKGLALMTSPYPCPNHRIFPVESKMTGVYASSKFMDNHAKRKGFDAALLLNKNGYVAQGTSANFFYEKDNVLYTSPTKDIFAGITRATVLELCEQLEIDLKEEHFTADEVRGADGAFFTGTITGIKGITSLDKVPFQLKWEDTLGYQLFRAYQRKVLEIEPLCIF